MSKEIIHEYIFSPAPGLRGDVVVFLDRDGVVNREVHLLHSVEDFDMLPGVIGAIKKLNDASIPVIVISNQTVVSRGMCDEKEIGRIHHRMVRELSLGGAKVDGIFYCPHSPQADVEQYRIDCDWRKPKSGMLKKALELLGNPLRRFMVGDMARDVLAGKDVGCVTIVVDTGHGGEDEVFGQDPNAKPDVRVADLSGAVDWILRQLL
ncbi:MAG: HAD-IIIA family hydrolase [bacterium]|nr:HAD-IIIA family hydrolase [bacterium]